MNKTDTVLIPSVKVTILTEPGPVTVTGTSGNLEAQKLCAAGIPATSEARMPMTPPQEDAENKDGVRRRVNKKPEICPRNISER